MGVPDFRLRLSGAFNANNSVLGTVADGGRSMIFDYDLVRQQMVVGRPASNMITLFSLPPLPELIFANGLE